MNEVRRMGRSGKLYVLASLTELLHPDAVEQALLKRQAYRASLDAVPCYQRRRLFAAAEAALVRRPRRRGIIPVSRRGLPGLQGRQTLGGISEVCHKLRSCGGSL